MYSMPHVEINIIDQVSSHESGLNIRQAVRQDFSETEVAIQNRHPWRSMLGMPAVMAVGATKAPTVAAMTIAAGTYEVTHLPPAAGVLAGLGTLAWNYAAARTLNSGRDHIPATMEAVSKKRWYQKVFKHVCDELPGLAPEPEDAKPAPLMSQMPTRMARGITIQGPGIASYTFAAGEQGQTKSQRRELCKNLAIDASLFMGALATGATTAVMAVAEKDPETAQHIIDGAQDTKIVFAVAWGIPLAKLAVKKVGRATRQIAENFRTRNDDDYAPSTFNP